jgi:alkanesulfonate monooxygenase SsuD/methylene tetrahydromethanopterin reductase-like flavin-dependent oxidoreductase (luciferase family)
VADPGPMRFSTFHLFHRFEHQSVREVYDHHIALAELAEEVGFDGIWIGEHHFRDYGTRPCSGISPPGPNGSGSAPA